METHRLQHAAEAAPSLSEVVGTHDQSLGPLDERIVEK